MLDIYSIFIKIDDKFNTFLCSYVDDSSIVERLFF